jgi:DNA-binding CsgD family transcriptional regulator
MRTDPKRRRWRRIGPGGAKQSKRNDKELSLQAVLDAIPDAVFKLSRDGTYLDFRAGAGVPLVRPTDLLGKRMHDVLSKDLADQAVDLIGRALSTGDLQTALYHMVVDGHMRYFEACIAPIDSDTVLTFVRDVTDRAAHVGVASGASGGGSAYGLTAREFDILVRIAAGRTDKEIAQGLAISPLTVHKHVTNILSKMGVSSRTEAGIHALREGLID